MKGFFYALLEGFVLFFLRFVLKLRCQIDRKVKLAKDLLSSWLVI